MKTLFHTVFAARIQGKPARPSRQAPVRAACLAIGLAVAVVAAPCPPAMADGGSEPSRYGPPPELPPGSHRDEDDGPRPDIHMGNVDHMRMGRDADGNEVMEIRPRPKPEQNQQVGPFYIYPQVGLPGGTPMGGQTGQGQPGMATPSGPGRGGPGMSGPGGQAGQAGRGSGGGS